jgi:phospholipid transport system substrate-binding protein
VSLVLLSSPTAARAVGPSDTLQEHVTQVLTLLRDPDLARPEATLRRRLAVRNVVNGVVDFPTMAERALGRYWDTRTPEERVEFVRLFSDLLETIYVGEIDRHSDQVVSYVNESLRGDDARVETRIRGKTEMKIDYRMHRRSDRWLVYDVLIGDLSIVENFRSQLQRMLRESSYASLVEKLRELTGGQAAARSRPM